MTTRSTSWRTASVIELQKEGVLLVEDGNHGEYRPRTDEFCESGVAFIRAADMNGGNVQFRSASKINEIARRRVRKGIGAPGDVLLSHKGTVGKVALVRDDAPQFVCSPQTTLWRSLDSKQLDRRYLFAFLRSSGFHDQLASRAGETDMAPYVSLTSQRGLVVTLPPIETQRAIASVLGALDDKIDLNRRMCQTLEEMARALFKSWFVDFDPVRAKMEGRDPGLPKEIADLFPSRLVDSELGPIPEGWRVGRTSDIADVIYGAPFASSRFNDQKHGVPLVRIRDLGSQAPAVWTDEVHPKGYRLSSGDVVVGMDGEFRAHLWAGPDAWLNQRVCVFKPRGGYCRVFVRNAITAPLEFIERTETATTVIHLGKSDIDQFKFVVAPTSVHQRFSDLALPWYGRMVAARHEAATLTALRDTLLPKLISGEIRVPASLGSMQEITT
jgi:type I restriction enzyme S subunit